MILKKGSKGDEVKEIQRALLVSPQDGIFGQKTEDAVKAFQKSKGLVADGIVGSKTWSLLSSSEDKSIAITKAYISTHITRLGNRPIKYIAVHYTAGSTSKKGTALNTRNVFLKRSASADFIVDDCSIVQVNPDLNNYYCWSVGDKKNVYSGGGKLYGIATNKNTISIEICSNLKKGYSASYANHDGWYFTDASLDNALKLIRHLMKEYCILKSNVVRHYDITGKLCPGIVGWNNANICDNNGKSVNLKSDSSKWLAFWSRI